MFELKKDCHHCIKLRLRNNKCTEWGKIITDVHNHTCELWKEDTWMTQNEKIKFEEEQDKDKQDSQLQLH